jgi:hypothetical protein
MKIKFEKIQNTITEEKLEKKGIKFTENCWFFI